MKVSKIDFSIFVSKVIGTYFKDKFFQNFEAAENFGAPENSRTFFRSAFSNLRLLKKFEKHGYNFTLKAWAKESSLF